MRVCFFADLEKAYDRVVREMAVGCRCTEADIASQLQCLGLDGDDLQWCLDFLRSDGSVMQEAGLEIELVDILERMYIGSWVFMQESGFPSDQTSVVETQCGGFSMLYAKATREVASCARSKNLSFTLPYDPFGAPRPCSAHSMTSHVEIFDVDFVDDTMWAVRANTPAELNDKLDRLLTLVETCFSLVPPIFEFWPWKDGMHDPVQRQGAPGCT